MSANYIYVKLLGHPRADCNGYVKRATLVAEAKLGRYLLPNEIAHHINGIKKDDRPENLIALDQYEHHRLHRLTYINQNAGITHCKNGHEFTPENTRICKEKNGTIQRKCLMCVKIDNARRYCERKQNTRA